MRPLVFLVAIIIASTSFLPAQSGAQILPSLPNQESPGEDSEATARRKVEGMLRGGRSDAATEYLESRREALGVLRPALASRLARLYRDLSRFEDLESLLTERIEAAGDEGGSSGELRMLAEARFSLGRPDDAWVVLRQLLAKDPADPSMMRLVANVLSQNGRLEQAVEVLVEGREKLDDPREFAQHLGTLYAQQGKWADAAGEYMLVILESPMNLSLMRGQILEMATRRDALDSVLARAEQIYGQQSDVPQLGLVLAELRQRSGDDDGAWRILRPLVVEPALLQDLIQMSMAGLADSRLPNADAQKGLSSLRLSSRVLKGLLLSGNLPNSLEPRVYDTLNRTLVATIENDHFQTLDADIRGKVLDEARNAILDMGERFQNNRVTSSALLRLANVYIDALHRPAEAIALFERLHSSPNASREELQLANVGLGRAYIAAGDTALARDLFTDMGKDRRFAEGQARAHYYLGLIDFMGGHFKTAQERLSSVALAAATAEYTNDALDLALLLVEQELAEGGGDTENLARYGRSLYHRAVFDIAELRSSLEEVAAGASSTLQQRSRLDLAKLFLESSSPTLALAQLDAVNAGALGRYSAQCGDLRGDVLSQMGRDGDAIANFEDLLVHHPDYVLIDGVREKLRELKAVEQSDTGDLP